MATELTNLLPPSKTREFRRHYFLRLATVGIMLLVALVVVNGILLLPSYLYANEQVSSESSVLARVSTSLASTQAQKIQAQLTNLQSEATYLSGLASTTPASATIRSILAVPHTGISLTGFTFTPPQDGNPASIQVSGVSGTRELLSAYNQSLQQLPFVANATLPISDYAQEANIPFTITLTENPS